MGCEECAEAGHDVGVFLRDICRLADVDFEVVELAFDEFPFAAADRFGAVKERIVGALGSFFRFEEGDEAFAIDDAVGGEFCSGDFRAGCKEVHTGHHFPAGFVSRDPARPPHDRGDAHAAFESAELVATERMRKATDLTVGVAFLPGILIELPWAVVGGVDDECVLIELQLAEGFENLSGGPIEFLDAVAIETDLALAFELRRGVDRDVRHAVGEIDEEGLLLVGRDELDRFFRVAFRECVLIDWIFDDFGVAHERDEVFLLVCFDALSGDPFAQGNIIGQRLGRVEGHVVAVGDAVVGVEALARREELFVVTEVPLADAGGRVALRFEELGDGDLSRVESASILREKHAKVTHPTRVATSQEGRTRRGADRGAGIEVREAHPFLRHLVDVGRFDFRGSETAEVLVALVVRHDDDDVGRGGRERQRSGHGEGQEKDG